MIVSLFQTDIRWADPKENRRNAEEMFRRVPGADLYVLPETFSTGFATVPEGIAEEEPSESLEWMKLMASELDAAIVGSVSVHSEGKYYNRMFFVKPDGEVRHYDKKHLFTYGGEGKYLTAGNERVVVEWRGVRFLLNICYDLRFPVWSRNRDDYDAMICVANWPQVRRLAWETLRGARAIENQCYVLAVNRVGDDPEVHYNGGTALINPYGELVSSVPDGETGFICAELDMEMLEAFRKKFPVVGDADKFTIDG